MKKCLIIALSLLIGMQPCYSVVDKEVQSAASEKDFEIKEYSAEKEVQTAKEKEVQTAKKREKREKKESLKIFGIIALLIVCLMVLSFLGVVGGMAA